MLLNLKNLFQEGARCSSVVERPLVERWVNGSIALGGPIELLYRAYLEHIFA